MPLFCLLIREWVAFDRDEFVGRSGYSQSRNGIELDYFREAWITVDDISNRTGLVKMNELPGKIIDHVAHFVGHNFRIILFAYILIEQDASDQAVRSTL